MPEQFKRYYEKQVSDLKAKKAHLQKHINELPESTAKTQAIEELRFTKNELSNFLAKIA